MNFKVLNKLILPENTSELKNSSTEEAISKEEQDIENINAAKQKMRTGSAPLGGPAFEEGAINDMWYAPDSILAGAAAPSIQQAIPAIRLAAVNALKSKASQNMLKPLMNEAGAIGKFKPSTEDLLKEYASAVEGKFVSPNLPKDIFTGKLSSGKSLPPQKTYKIDPDLGMKSNQKSLLYKGFTPKDNEEAAAYHTAQSFHYFTKLSRLIDEADESLYGLYKTPRRSGDYILGNNYDKYPKETLKDIIDLKNKYKLHQDASFIHRDLAKPEYHNQLLEQVIAEGGETPILNKLKSTK